MRFETILPLLRDEHRIVFHGSYMHKIEDESFFVTDMHGIWMEIEPETEMFLCNNWNLVGGPNWRNHI